MASDDLLNFAQLRAAIPGDNPAGKPLREDYSPRSAYQLLKDAQKAARDAERAIVWEDAGGDLQARLASCRVGWKPVLELASRITAEESKDLQVVSWWIEALLRVHGFPGVRDGFRLARELIEEHWEHLYPLPDEDGIATRVGPLAGLNGVESDGVLVNPLLNLPITAAGSLRAMSLVDFQQANDLERIQDPQRRAQRVHDGAITQEIFQKSVAETNSEFFSHLLEDITACAVEFDKLSAELDEKCGRGADGHSQAPPTSNIRNAIASVREQVELFVRSRGGLVGGGNASASDEALPAAARAASVNGTGSIGTGPIGSRDEAFGVLMQVADYFRRAEPHSPIPYLLEQAVRWGKLPLPELLNELLPVDAVSAQTFKLLGIRLPERKE